MGLGKRKLLKKKKKILSAFLCKAHPKFLLMFRLKLGLFHPLWVLEMEM